MLLHSCSLDTYNLARLTRAVAVTPDRTMLESQQGEAKLTCGRQFSLGVFKHCRRCRKRMRQAWAAVPIWPLDTFVPKGGRETMQINQAFPISSKVTMTEVFCKSLPTWRSHRFPHCLCNPFQWPCMLMPNICTYCPLRKNYLLQKKKFLSTFKGHVCHTK